jgi:hypothetical protein
MSDRSWIVCYTLMDTTTGSFQDEWEIFESYDDAYMHHDTLCKTEDNLHTSTICAVIESTDYEAHRMFRQPGEIT